MNLNIEIANTPVTKLYLAGVLKKHRLFPPVSGKEISRIKSMIKNFQIVQIPEVDYNEFKMIKLRLLKNERNPLYKMLYESLKNIEIDIDTKKAEDLGSNLKAIYVKYNSEISGWLQKENLIAPNIFNVYVIPGLGENAESLIRTAVLGDGFNAEEAFAVVLEELLHNVLNEDHFRKFDQLIEKKDILDEIVTGYFLYQLLTFLRFNKKLTNSFVFGWHGGARKKDVSKLLQALKTEQ